MKKYNNNYCHQLYRSKDLFVLINMIYSILNKNIIATCNHFKDFTQDLVTVSLVHGECSAGQ
jgi:hypothetical protein